MVGKLNTQNGLFTTILRGIQDGQTVNTKEITEYEYDRDKEGNVISGYPDGDDHAISALRYAYEPLFNRRGYSA